MRADSAAPHGAARWRWQRILAWALLVLLLLVALPVVFPWDWMRGPLNRYVSERTGRHFEITRRLDVRFGFPIRVIAEGLVVGNPEWATERYLVEAERAEVEIKLLPLILHRRLELPWVSLRRPRLGLELLPDGRRSWSLERGEGRERGMQVGAMALDQGSLRFIAPQYGADLRADFVLEGQPKTPDAAMLPLSFRGGGRWRGESVVIEGRAGNVLALRESGAEPFPAEIYATSGKSSLRAAGRIGSLLGFEGADITLALSGRNLAELNGVTGLVLPATPAYTLESRLRHQAQRWQATDLRAVIGRSPISGELAYDNSGEVPQLTGSLHSRRLDFDDLAPLLGLDRKPARGAAQRNAKAPPASPRAGDRVLPQTRLSVAALTRMNADVQFSADRVVDARPLPLDRIATHVRLQDGVLALDPLEFGIAGGRVAGDLRLAGASRPVQARLQLTAQGLRLDRMFTAAELNRASAGQVRGRLSLAGQGDSVAELLGSATGEVALLMGQGRISNLLLEILGLDGAEIIKFMMGRDQRVLLRCAAANFAVDNGMMSSRALVLDTADTVVYGHGLVNLATERLELEFRPYPKDPSILTLRSPLKLTGTLARPEASVDRAAVAGRAAIAVALAAINPLLGLAATVETGPGEDADCAQVLKQAAMPRQEPPAPPAAPPARGQRP